LTEPKRALPPHLKTTQARLQTARRKRHQSAFQSFWLSGQCRSARCLFTLTSHVLNIVFSTWVSIRRLSFLLSFPCLTFKLLVYVLLFFSSPLLSHTRGLWAHLYHYIHHLHDSHDEGGPVRKQNTPSLPRHRQAGNYSRMMLRNSKSINSINTNQFHSYLWLNNVVKPSETFISLPCWWFGP